MYEQADSRAVIIRRIIWLALWLIVILAVVWALVWFVFIRGHSSTAAKKSGDTLKSHVQNTTGTTKSSDDKHTGSDTGTSSQQQTADTGRSGSSTDTPQPTQLVNTGAGNVVVPVVVAMISGGVAYQVYLRRKYRLD
jgi:cytoskeletal protein RodZ